MCHRLTVFLHVPPGGHAPSTRTMTPATLVDRSGHLLPIVRRRRRSKNRSNRVCSRPPHAPGRRLHDNTQTNKPVSLNDRVWALSTHYIVLIRPQQTPPLASMYCQLSNFKYSLILCSWRSKLVLLHRAKAQRDKKPRLSHQPSVYSFSLKGA